MESVDIRYSAMLMLYGVLLIPIIISFVLKLGTVKTILISVLRMTLQLGAMGLYLDYIFRFNNIWVNFGYILLMILIANFTVIKNAGLRTVKVFFAVMLGITVSALTVIALFIFLSIKPEPFYDARYLIPITGMVVGNCMRANVISLERFYSSIRKNEKEFLTYLLMGASLKEAILPYMREAVKPALAPQLSTIATLGIVSLPGMMTGQILGGSSPIVAIKYQIGVMIAIFTAITLTTVFNLLISLKTSFDDYSILRKDIFRQQQT
jgi:putative ABC transport system permease protein